MGASIMRLARISCDKMKNAGAWGSNVGPPAKIDKGVNCIVKKGKERKLWALPPGKRGCDRPPSDGSPADHQHTEHKRNAMPAQFGAG
jgi:hypothetical protein